MTTDPHPLPEVLTSPLLSTPGLLHGFTTRRGGVSQGPFASLNFSPKWPEEMEAVEANHRLLARHLGYSPDRLYRVFQVHGREGVVVEHQSPGEIYTHQADYLVTDRPGVVLGVITADCVSVLLHDPVRRAVGAVHAGWRGLVAGVIEAAVALLGDRFGSAPGDLRAALGPSIGPCCFEVGPEVVEAFRGAFGETTGFATWPASDTDRLGKPHVDLWAATRRALERAGVASDRIADPPGCTHCDAARFHSYRREGPRVGQHLSVIGLLGPDGSSDIDPRRG